ncbi:MAG: aminotransferase class I/II-fold pyridoxal phosphate-dependent enzyme, partial [Spirochaetia bacterium]|nr:aminotransferase class I/II-fold pyridoxal phosphate-dependent enzyme [Spirochaetia bacterium]
MFTSRRVQKLIPYVYGEQPRPVPGLVKLNTNENPWPPHASVRKLLRGLDTDFLRLYPDPTCASLRKAASKVLGVPENCLLFGNGSDELISLVFRVFFDPGEKVLFTQYTYSAYRSYADAVGIPSADLPMGPDFKIDLRKLTSRNEKVFFLTNPNAPTGIGLDAKIIAKALAANPRKLFIVDEAYADFAGSTCVPLVGRYSNLIVLRTLSKSYSLCGLRLGCAVAQPALLESLIKVKDPYNVNALTQRVGELAFENSAYYLKNAKKIVAERGHFTRAMKALGFTTPPSSANFVLTGKPGQSQAPLYRHLVS